MIQKLSSVNVLGHSGFAIKCCPMADSQLILDLLFLHVRGGCSLAVLLFFLMLVGTCVIFCFVFTRMTHILLRFREYPTALAGHATF